MSPNQARVVKRLIPTFKRDVNPTRKRWSERDLVDLVLVPGDVFLIIGFTQRFDATGFVIEEAIEILTHDGLKIASRRTTLRDSAPIQEETSA